MHKLRRRTCPGFDGRRNRPNTSLPPPPSASITWSNEQDDVVQEKNAGAKEETTQEMFSPTGAGIKVSRSPSPTSSPMNHLPVGRGSVCTSDALIRRPSPKSILSNEEKSPWSRQTSIASTTSFDHGHNREGQKSSNSSYSTDLEMNEYYVQSHVPANPPVDPLQAEECIVDQLTHHLHAPSREDLAATTFTKKSRKAKLTHSIWSDDEEKSNLSTSSRKKYSKEELKEQQAQLLAVTEVSRRLNGICADYALSVAERKPRGSGRGKGRGRLGSSAPVTIPAQSIPLFGLDKPHNHYYGVGKCDLFTYDCDDGFTVDVDQDDGSHDEKRKDEPQGVTRPAREVEEETLAPPSICPLVNQSLVQACLEGRLVLASTLERTLAAAVLSFCLSTHPRDPFLADKIAAHLKKGPMLAKEFNLYREAMAPGVRGAAGDLSRDWETFSLNFINRLVLGRRKSAQLTAAENEAIERCVASWSCCQ